jgi:hypothetical protein
MVTEKEFCKLIAVIYKHITKLEFYYYFAYNFLYKENEKENKEQVDLLTDTFPSFFYCAQYSFWETGVLILCRLNDPLDNNNSQKTKGEENKNCSFELLMKVSEKHTKLKENPKVIKTLNKKLADFRKSMKPVNLYRNKLIGHSDLKAHCEYVDNESNIINEDLKISRECNEKAFLKAKDFFATYYDFMVDDINKKFKVNNSFLEEEAKNFTNVLKKYKRKRSNIFYKLIKRIRRK